MNNRNPCSNLCKSCTPNSSNYPQQKGKFVASTNGKAAVAGAYQKTSYKKHSGRSSKSSDSPRDSLSLAEFLDLKKPTGDVTVDVDGIAVALTSLDRVYWPKEKITKFDLLCYYIEIRDHILPFLKIARQFCSVIHVGLKRRCSFNMISRAHQKI